MGNPKRLCISLAVIWSMLLLPITLTAQNTSSTGDWSALRNIPVESKISVKLKTGKTVEGKFKMISDSTLTLASKGSPVDVKREDVANVYQVTKKSATASTLIGMGVGAGSGAVIGLIGSGNDTYDFDKLDRAVTGGLAVIGAVGGAVTGYFIGRGRTKRLLIYESK